MTAKSLFFCAALAAAPATTHLAAVNPGVQQVLANDEWCGNDNSGDRESVCEVRQYTVPATGGALAVDAKPNGGIQVEGSARGDVLVRAKVMANAETKERARQIAASVQVNVGADRISATGPDRTDRNEGWAVSYQLAVPERTSLSLESVNGGISIAHVDGRIEFTTVNGGVKLRALAGDVRGRTSNGGVDVDLEGTTWQGDGLDVETRNGGVKVTMPENYSAHLQTGTVNGGLRSDFASPDEPRPDGRRERNIDAQIGAGGPLIRVRTTNGGIKVTKK